MPIDNIQGAALATYMKDEGVTNVYILDDAEVYGKGVAKNTQTAAEGLGIKIAGTDSWDGAAANYRALADKIKATGADAVFTGGIIDNNGPQLYKDLHASMPDAKLFGPDGMATVDFTKEIPEEVQAQTYLTAPTLAPDELPPAGQQFYKDYEAEYGEPQDEIDPYAVYGYEAMSVVCDSIAQGGDDRQAVIDAFFATNGPREPAGHVRHRSGRRHHALRLRRIQGRRRQAGVQQGDQGGDQLGRSHETTEAGRSRGRPAAVRGPPAMESASIPARPPRARGDVLRENISKWGLIVLLLALPVYYGITDLIDDGSLTRVANNIVDGLSNGAIWALIAIGYTLVYGIIELINFAHGDLFMIGSFIAFGMIGAIGLTTSTAGLALVGGLVVCILVAMVGCSTLNVMIERVGYRPLRNAPKLAPLITAVGFSFILQNVGLLWLGGSHTSVPDLIDSQDNLFTIGGVEFSNGDVFAFVVTIPLVVVLVNFIARSRIGRAMRATAQDPEAARLMGINVDTTISFTFLLGGLMAGAAGLISALYQTDVWFFSGFTAGLLSFTAAVMGGIGNLKGAVLGGLIIGVIQQISDNRIGTEWTAAIVFGYLVLILVFRPQGLLGEQTREAG